METTSVISLIGGLTMLALIVLAVAARVVVSNGVAGLGYGWFGIEAVKLAHLAVGLLLYGLVSALAR